MLERLRCYQYQTQVDFNVTKWGTSDSYRLTVIMNRPMDAQQEKQTCSMAASSSAWTSLSEVEMVDGLYALAGYGKVYDYAKDNCEGGTPVFDLEGTLTIKLYYKRAPYVWE